MPIFEYKCDKCGHIFEHFNFNGAKEDTRSCPRCQAEGAKKIVSSFSSMFGGSDEGCGGGCGSNNRGFS